MPLPSDEEIEEAVSVARIKATKKAAALGMHLQSKSIPRPTSKVFTDTLEVTSDIIEERDGGNKSEDEDVNQVLDETDENSDTEDRVEDALIVLGDMAMETFQVANITSDSLFVKIKNVKGNITVIRKTTLVWMLNSGDSKISCDRLKSVKEITPASKLFCLASH